MKNLYAVMFAVICLTGCGKKDTVAPAASETQCLSDHFYYYQNTPYPLDDKLRQDYMIVGFDTSITDGAIVSFINSRPEFTAIAANNVRQNPNDAFKVVLGKFSSPKTCSQINSIRTNLMLANEVVLANYTYKDMAWIGGNTYEIMTYTDNFIVRLNDPADLTTLDSLMALNNMSATQNQFDSKVFLVSITKSSPGDALKMANTFHETGLFEWSAPNFAYFRLN